MLSSDMNGNDYDSMGPGTIQDVGTHPANNLPGPSSPAMTHSTQMAGSVTTISGMQDGPGQDSRAVDYATGKAKDPKVLSIGTPNLKSWLDRTNSRLNLNK